MKLDGKKLVKINTVHLLIWLIPGAVVNYLLRSQLWWTNFMSWFAIVLTLGTLWGTSRTEKKQDESNEQS